MAAAMVAALAERQRLDDATAAGMTMVRLEGHDEGLGRQLLGDREALGRALVCADL